MRADAVVAALDGTNILQEIYTIYTNSEKKQMGLNLFGKLERSLEAWVDWEAKQREQEVA